MDERDEPVGSLDLLGGRTSLDFANTVDWHASDQPVEYLTSYTGLVAWGQHVSILNERQAEHLLEEAGRRPTEANAVHHRALVFRETIYRIFAEIPAGRPARDDDFAVFNGELSHALARARVVPYPDGYTWGWTGQDDALDRMLWPVVRDTADLLTSEDLIRVGQCADDRCGWLFPDTSRNHSRRWCSMEDSGNRAKARRHYRRGRASAGG